MKNLFCTMLAIAMLLGCMPGALAQDMVSIAELYDQAQAMGGWWKETFDTPNGEVTVDAPIIVPDVETMPVITVEGAKISEELYNQIILGKKGGEADELMYDEVWLGGKSNEFYLGRENDYVNGVKTNAVGYEAANTLWIQHGDYRYSVGKSSLDRAEPTTYHFPWQLDPDQACLRNSNLTLDDAFRLWQEDIDMCFPDDSFVIQPTTIVARGSTLIDKTGKGKEYKRDGCLRISAEQVIDGVPLLGGIIHDFGASQFAVRFTADSKTNRAIEKMNKKYGTGVASVIDYKSLQARFSNEESYRTLNDTFARIRTVEYVDVPLASIDCVTERVRKEIETGNIREVYSIRLGYVLYSNPDMTDHAWAIPRWIVNALYITKGNQRNWEKTKKADAKWGYEYGPWEQRYAEELLIDAQSGEMLIFTVGDDRIYSVPEITTWDEVQ